MINMILTFLGGLGFGAAFIIPGTQGLLALLSGGLVGVAIARQQEQRKKA